jgi:hypothetical protein
MYASADDEHTTIDTILALVQPEIEVDNLGGRFDCITSLYLCLFFTSRSSASRPNAHN